MENLNQETQHTEKPVYARNITNPFILSALAGDNSWYKYVGGALLIIGFFLVGQTPLSIGLMVFAFMKGLDAESMGDIGLIISSGFDKNLFLFLNIIAFMIGVLGVWIVVKFFHKRPFLTLITSAKKLNYKKLALAFGIYLLLTASIEMFMYFQNPDNYILQFNAGRFAILMLITVLFMPFQTSFEELYFRGYLMQGFSFLFRSTIPALLITAVLFALVHSGNPEVKKYGFWVMFPYYCGFGLLLGFITLKDKSMEIALAVHAANNMFSSMFLTFEGSALETDAIFRQKEMDPMTMMPYYFASMFAFLLICSFVFGWWKKSTPTEQNAA